MTSVSRRGFMAGTAALMAAGFSMRVNAQGQRVLTATIPSTPSTLDPLNQSNHDAMAVSQLIYENLLEVDVDGKLVPQLAVALPDISDDRKTYTFRLREGVTFQNGKPFTAADVKYSYDFMLDPENKALRRAYWEVIDAVEIVSDYEVKFHLSRPYRPLLDSMTKYMGIFPAGSREDVGADAFQNVPAGLGTGPAIFKRAESGNFIELERNPDYWGDAPDWDIVRIDIASEANARVAALMSGGADVVGGPSARDYLRLTAQGGDISGAAKPALGAAMMMMHNCGVAPFDDVHFRRAVARAIDRAAVAEKIYGGLLEPTSVLVPQASPYFDGEAAAKLAFDLEAAKAELSASAYADQPAFDLIYPTDAYLLDVRDTALYIQAALAAIGITVTLTPLETGQMFGEIFNGNHQTVLWAVVGTVDPTFIMNALFMEGQALNAGTNYQNEKLSALIAQSQSVAEDALGPILSEAQALLAEEAPAAFIGTPSAFNLWGPRVSAFEVNTGITLRLRDVKLVA
ncbi:ABC transporter substrate-binding protein [Martelella soudanensis]|uniref:ABC transporter substrate-binding protein n=1 Tax=unclassified Martelella TaxID=2629616 RepID=UPI0015DF578C|nr:MULTISPECIES: ABC transporter substrate-binding protein [unclassified Martelella]